LLAFGYPSGPQARCWRLPPFEQQTVNAPGEIPMTKGVGFSDTINVLRVRAAPCPEAARRSNCDGTFAAKIGWGLGSEIFRMQRMGRWFKELFGAARLPVRDEKLPFTAEEFGRLIGSGRSEDMRSLARGLGRKSTGRVSADRASIQ